MGRWHPEFTKYQAIAKSPTMKRENSLTESDFEYEHFPVVCPTCEGKGEICEDSHGLVTFVPVKDKRLKPAWTKLKVALLILVLVGTGGLSTYFLCPRTVEFHVSAHDILNFNFKTDKPWLTYNFDVSIKNKNFFSVAVRDITMNLLFMKQSICKLEIGSIHVGMRGEVKTVITMNATYDDDVSKKYLRKQCYIERDYVGQLMQTSGELDYWVHSEHIESRDDYFYTDCGSLVFPLVVKTTLPPSTTTMPTITTTTTTLNTTATLPTTTTVNTTPVTTNPPGVNTTTTISTIASHSKSTTSSYLPTTKDKTTTRSTTPAATFSNHASPFQTTTIAAKSYKPKITVRITVAGHVISYDGKLAEKKKKTD